MDIEQPVKLQRTANPLDVPLSRLVTLNWATVVLGALLLVAFVSRFWELGRMALHHDESLHALYSWNLYDHGVYRHEPLMHGPVLFHLTALGYWLFGDSDFTARLVPAILGVFLVWAPWKFRGWLGTKGALATSALILLSPTLLYYSRFIRHDIFVAAWTVVILYGMWKYLEGGETFHLAVMAAGWGLLFSQKEVSFLLAMVFWSFLALIFLLRFFGKLGPKVAPKVSREFHLLVFLGALLLPFVTALIMHAPALLNAALGLSLPIWDPGAVGGNSETSVYNNPAAWPMDFNIRAYATAAILALVGFVAAARLWDWRKFLIGAGVFYTIFILFHTTFLTNPYGIGSGMIGALGYWLEQHGVQRGEQPWYYYSMLLPLYELTPLLIGLVGGGFLLARGRNGRIAPEAGDEPHLNTRALWPYLNLWWFVGTFLLLSYAGEKMPWLTVHLALPLAFLGGWALGQLLDRVDWERARMAGGLWFALLFLVVLLALGSLLWMMATGQFPFQGSGETALEQTGRWLVTVLFLVGAVWAATTFREQLGSRTAIHVVLLTITVVLAAATLRFAVIAAYINADTASEPLIYVQSSPMVTAVMDDLDAISERIAGDKNLKIAYDNHTSWPFSWYLRDYPNAFFFGADPQTYADAVRGASVVLVGQQNEQKLKPLVNGYVRHEYKMRWWFPEDYRDVKEVVQRDPNNPDNWITTGERSGSPLVILQNLWRFAQQPEYRQDFIDFYLHRRVKDPLAGEPFIVYIKPEVAAEVWQYGSADVLAEQPTFVDDPYLAAAVELPASQIVQPGDFQVPHDVAVSPDGNLVVADSGNHRIRIVSPEGTVMREFGSSGTEPGQFNEPWGVAVAPDGTIYVADTWNHRIQHLDEEGNVLDVWGTFGETAGQLGDPNLFWGPRDVVVDDESNVYVTDTGNKRILRFDAEGTFLNQFGGGGIETGQLSEPVGLAISPDGTIWVADTWNRRIQRFTPEGEPLQQIPIQTWAGENITNKPYIAASDDRLWISDPESYRIIELDHTGNVQRIWGQFGTDATALNMPHGLAVNGDTLWVADSENQRILGYNVE
ncbi:MAG: TIGR03663 family protein [Chloroflexota bacterium]|nr:TIGR03663 family protein [Chloroflexota bacterium]